jgi:NAD(P) transhydrogenase subunit alpha
MQIGIPTETVVGENRVAATPETVKKLISAGHSVVIERGAGVKLRILTVLMNRSVQPLQMMPIQAVKLF